MPSHLLGVRDSLTPDPGVTTVRWVPLSLIDSGTVVDPLVLVFDTGSTKDGAHGIFECPINYVGTLTVRIVWIANAMSGDAILEFESLSLGDSADSGAAVTDNDGTTLGTDGTAFNTNTTTITITDADLTAGQVVLFSVFRDQADANDDLAVALAVLSVQVRFNDA